nr:hypothetical transcript [Hymenolepis microstoma]
MKDAEHKVASLDEEEKRMNSVKEALIREFLPKPLADKTLEAISNGSDEMEALESSMKPNRYPQVTICALRLPNFYESTLNLPPEEIVVALNRLNRLVTNIIEERQIFRISSFGTIVMMTSDPQGEYKDSVKQAISVTNCALDLQNCLRCFGKIPRTDVNPEFAIALDTGAVAMGVMPGNVPSLCVFGKVMQNARNILKFAAPKYVCLTKTTKELLSDEDRFEMTEICTDTEIVSNASKESQKKGKFVSVINGTTETIVEIGEIERNRIRTVAG